MSVTNQPHVYNCVDLSEYATKQELDDAAAAWSAGYTPKGPASVSTINGLTGQQNGDVYILTDSGTVNPGALSVSEGNQIAWDADNSVWYKFTEYALKSVQDELIKNALQSTRLVNSTSIAENEFTNSRDVKEARPQTGYIIVPSNVVGLPIDEIGTLVTINGRPNNSSGRLQLYITVNGNFYYRYIYTTTPTDWVRVVNSDEVKTDQVNKITLNGDTAVNVTLAAKEGEVFIINTNPSTWDVTGISDSTNVFFVQSTYDGITTTLAAITKSDFNGVNNLQIIAPHTENLKIRLRGKIGDTVKVRITNITYVANYVLEILNKIKNDPENIEMRPCISYFESIGVIGASYESGVVFKDENTALPANYPKSWPQIMARNKGIDVTNFSFGGATTKSWKTNVTYGLPALLADEEKELYIVNLGSNDNHQYGTEYIGSVDDIGTETDSFYGNLSSIIESIQTKAPNAKIVLGEIRNNVTGGTALFNDAIRNIADHYGLPFVTPYKDPYYSTATYLNMVGGHPLYVGYAGMAKAWSRMIEVCMYKNMSYFNSIPE